MRIGLKMQSEAYMFINRLGSYHRNLSLEAFFNIKLVHVATESASQRSDSAMQVWYVKDMMSSAGNSPNKD